MRFNWEIEEASGEDIPVRDAEEINLNDVKVVVVSGWAVKEPDETETLQTVSGGTVEKIEKLRKPETAPSVSKQTNVSLDSGKKFNQRMLLLVAVLFGLGFLAVVTDGVIRGSLDFHGYMVTIAAFLAGLGVGNFKN